MSQSQHLSWPQGQHVSRASAPRYKGRCEATAPPDYEWAPLVGALDHHNRFATAAWFASWAETFLPFQDWVPPMRYVSVRDDAGVLRAVFPVATQRKSVVSVASLGGFYWPYRAAALPPDASPQVCDALAHALKSTSSFAVRYGPVAATDGGIARLNEALQRNGWNVRGTDLGATYAVELPGTWEEYEERLSKKLRWNIRYYERKMAREGELEIECLKSTAGERWSKVVEDLGRIESMSWQQRANGKARFVGEPNRSFWTKLLAQTPFGSMAAVWVIRFNGQPVSFCFCLDCGDTRHILANHYADGVRDYSTGTILYGYVFRDAIASGTLKRINIGIGDSGYKSAWGATPSFTLMDYLAFRPGAGGRLLALATRLR